MFERRPEARANGRRQHAVQVLERRAAQVRVVGMQAAQGGLYRIGRQDERQQREDVRETLAGASLHELVDVRLPVRLVHAIEQAVTGPDRPADGHLPQDHCVDALGVEADSRVFLLDRRQRPAALEPDLEPLVVEPEQQTVGRALRHADREHAREPPAHGERLVGIEQRVDELADALLRHLAQRVDRVLRYRVPCEQRDDVRHERRRHTVLGAQHRHDPIALTRTQREDLVDLRVDALRNRRRHMDLRRQPLPRQGAAHRPQHDRTRRQVLDLREIELDGAVQQAALQRVHVAAIQAAGDDERQRRTGDGHEEDDVVLRGGREQQHHLHDAAAERVAEAVDADVDERLRRTLFSHRDRRVEELVPRPVQRTAEYRFPAARRRGAGEPRRQQAADTAGQQRERRRTGTDGKAELFERHPARRGLQDEGDEARARVIDREEPQEGVAASEGRHRLGLEDVIDQRRAQRAEQHECGEVSQVRRFGEHAEAGTCRNRRELRRRIDSATLAHVAHRRCELTDLPGREKVQDRQDRQHRGHTEDAGHALGEQGPGKAAQRADTRNLPKALLGRVRIETLAGDEPEARAEHRANARDLQVDHGRRDTGGDEDQRPLSQQQHRAHRKRQRDERTR